jgi:hypothetical protein
VVARDGGIDAVTRTLRPHTKAIQLSLGRHGANPILTPSGDHERQDTDGMSAWKDALGWAAFVAPIGGFLTGLRGWRPWLYFVWPGLVIALAIVVWPGPNERNKTWGLLSIALVIYAVFTIACTITGRQVRRRRT